LPRFLGDVLRVELKDETTSRWTVRAPLGIDIHWSVVITRVQANTLIAYETRSFIAPVQWRICFAAGREQGTPEVHEVMTLPGGRIGKATLAALGKPPANLMRLKELLETGRIKTTKYRVGGPRLRC
jgi:uncharacterized membrane protein